MANTANHTSSMALIKVTPMPSSGESLYMVMIVFLMKKFIRGYFAIVWDARWSPTIFLTSFPVSSNNQKNQFYCGFTGKLLFRILLGYFCYKLTLSILVNASLRCTCPVILRENILIEGLAAVAQNTFLSHLFLLLLSFPCFENEIGVRL